jgi:hypothetical protein
MLLGNERVDVNSKDNTLKRTPLSLAVESGHEKVVRALLSKEGVGVNTKEKGRSAAVTGCRERE